tara:strand:- start:142 stop:672 length:531 start_codon:yes stop_codon:yes gene_type:complete
MRINKKYAGGGKPTGPSFNKPRKKYEDQDRYDKPPTGVIPPPPPPPGPPGYEDGGIPKGQEDKPVDPLVVKNPDGGKWLGDEMPPMYSATEEHIPFLTSVYEYMDAGMNMEEIYDTQGHLRPYIDFIHAGQNGVDTMLPAIKNQGRPGFIEESDDPVESIKAYGTTPIDKSNPTKY